MAFPRPLISEFSGGACLKTLLGWAAFGATTFLPCVCTPSKSHATPLPSLSSVPLLLLS